MPDEREKETDPEVDEETTAQPPEGDDDDDFDPSIPFQPGQKPDVPAG